MFDTIELRTKVVLNTSGYPTLPGYSPIWEVVSKVPAAESKLVINERFDVVDQPKTNKQLRQWKKLSKGINQYQLLLIHLYHQFQKT